MITGTLDHKKMRENYLDALKNPAVADPYYKELDVERQVRQADGSWSEWTAVDRAENLKILDNLPEEDEELTPEDVRIAGLVDPLPFLKAGYWEKVHVASLVPLERREIRRRRMSAAGRHGGWHGHGDGGGCPAWRCRARRWAWVPWRTCRGMGMDGHVRHGRCGMGMGGMGMAGMDGPRI